MSEQASATEKICFEDFRRIQALQSMNACMDLIAKYITDAINSAEWVSPKVLVTWENRVNTDVQSGEYNPLGNVGRFLIEPALPAGPRDCEHRTILSAAQKPSPTNTL